MLVVVGCIIAGIGDLAFDAWAYAFAFSSVITQALYLLLVEFQASIGGFGDKFKQPLA
jgi:solute carrier family 35 protein